MTRVNKRLSLPGINCHDKSIIRSPHLNVEKKSSYKNLRLFYLQKPITIRMKMLTRQTSDPLRNIFFWLKHRVKSFNCIYIQVNFSAVNSIYFCPWNFNLKNRWNITNQIADTTLFRMAHTRRLDKHQLLDQCLPFIQKPILICFQQLCYHLSCTSPKHPNYCLSAELHIMLHTHFKFLRL